MMSALSRGLHREHIESYTLERGLGGWPRWAGRSGAGTSVLDMLAGSEAVTPGLIEYGESAASRCGAIPLGECSVSDTTATVPAEATPSRLPTALVYDSAFLDHLVPDEFPEQPERLRKSMEVIEALLGAGLRPARHVLALASRVGRRAER